MFFIKYFAILVIAVAVEAQVVADATALINEINYVVLAEHSKTCVIFVCDGNVQFVATKSNSEKLLRKLGVAMEKVQIFKEKYEAFNPLEILMKLAKLRAKSKHFVVYFTAEGGTMTTPKPSQPPPPPTQSSPHTTRLPESISKQTKDIILLVKSYTIVTLVNDGLVELVATDPDTDC